MGLGSTLILGIIFLIVVVIFWGQISTGFSALQADAAKKATIALEKQEAEARIILPKVGQTVCELQLHVSGYLDYDTLSDILKFPNSQTVAHLSGDSISYNWVNCVKYAGTTMELLALSAPDPWNPLSLLPISGDVTIKVELIGADQKYLNPDNLPALTKTFSIDNQYTPVQISKTFYVTKLPKQDYTANIVFDGGSINGMQVNKPYVYKILG